MENENLETGEEKLEILKNLRPKFYLGKRRGRREFFRQFKNLSAGWRDHLPDLRDFLPREEIDWLLTKCVTTGSNELIGFVASTGYRDEPELDEDGNPRLRRTTPLHHVVRHESGLSKQTVRQLFKIFHRFDVNYTDESGLTHFHVACLFGSKKIVEKFLEFGQNPNLVRRKTGDSPLHLAVYNREKVVKLLLRRGADWNLADRTGCTPLHNICQHCVPDYGLLKLIFEIADERQQSVRIDARNNQGKTPLDLAVKSRDRATVAILLRRGADPNAADKDGNTAMHTIARPPVRMDFLKKFFRICCDEGRTVQLDARDKCGRTPMHVALLYNNIHVVEWLLRHGADPSPALHCIASKPAANGFARELLRIIGEIQWTAKVDAPDDLGRTALRLALRGAGNEKAAEWLLRNGADPNLADQDGWRPLHYIALRKVDDDLAKRFFEICDEMELTLQVDARQKKGWTPMHVALRHGNLKLVELLLRRGADPNAADEEGSTALHIICEEEVDVDSLELFFRINDDIQQTVLIDARDKLGNTPLLSALRYDRRIVVESLLRRGANPNSANKQGTTPLHVICKMYDIDFVEKFIEICDGMQQTVQIDAQDKPGRTPLYVALSYVNQKNVVEWLLRNGANPNLAKNNGTTPLHKICTVQADPDLLELFFKIKDDSRQQVQIDARDKRGCTPLHLALRHCGDSKMVELLLREGANPNLLVADAYTPLHLICIRKYADDFMKTFFRINDDLRQTVLVDAQDKKGRTPLQFAVTNILPGVVDVLLDHGADLSSFVFPTENSFCEMFDEIKCQWDKLKLASGALAVLERLEDREYDLSRSDVLTIIQLFVKYELFEKSDLSEKCWYDEEEFTSRAKEITIIPNLSLYDLIQLRPEEAVQLLTYTNYFEIERLNNLEKIPEQYRDKCLRYLCEKMSRRYFKSLALDTFQELIHYRLPILGSDMVIENLKNEDLFRIYEAGEIVAKENNAKLSDTVDNGPVEQKVQLIKRQRS